MPIPGGGCGAVLTLDLLDRLGVRIRPAQILDAGCGWGVTLQALSGAAIKSWGWISQGGPFSNSTAQAAAWSRPTWLTSARSERKVTLCWLWM